MDNNFLVSICIPAYNGEHLISRALESCINQTYKNIEIVVIDDCSRDKTSEIVKKYSSKDPRIKFYQNEKNLGVAENFLKSYKLASGYFLQHLGQDDWLDKNYIEEKIKIFHHFPDAAFVSSGIASYIQGANGSLILKNKTLYKAGFYPAEFIFKYFYSMPKLGLIGLMCMVRRDEMVGNFMTTIPNQYNYGDFYKKGKVIDNIVFLNILVEYKNFYYTDKVFYNALNHPQNASKFFNLENSLPDIIKSAHIDSVGFMYFYKNRKPRYLFRYKVFSGSDILATIFLNIILRRVRGFFGKTMYQALQNFFGDYSLLEKAVIVIFAPWRILNRILIFLNKIF
jgi:glycosyltransferase involved in cell wall biosynthesis